MNAIGVETKVGRGNVLFTDNLQFVEHKGQVVFGDEGKLSDSVSKLIARVGYSYQAESPAHFYVAAK